MHAVLTTLDLVRQRLCAHSQRIGIRHFENGSDPAHHRGKRTAFEVFLMREARFAKVNLGVDYARQNMKAPAIDDFAG